MADPTIAEAISLLTKVSADTAQRLKSLEKGLRASGGRPGKSTTSRGSTAPREAEGPREIVEKPKDVVITDFGPDAEADLAAAFGRETEAALEKQQNKNNSDLMGLLKLLGIGAAVWALADGQGIVGLVSGLQKVYSRINKFASKAKGIFTRLGKAIGSFARSIGKKATSLLNRAGKAVGRAVSAMGRMAKRMVTRIGNKLKSVATGVKKGISSAILKVKDVVKSISTKFGGAFKAITSKVASWSKALVSGMKSTISKVAEGAAKVTGSKAGGFVQRALAGAKSAAGAVAGGAKKIAAKGASVAAGAAGKVAAKAADIGKGALKLAMKSSGGIGKVLNVAFKGAAPILEAIFVKKDVNKYQDDYASGKIETREELNQKVGMRALKAVGGVLGGLSGAALGSFLGPIGTVAGGVLGDIGGRWIADKLIAPMMGKNLDRVGEWAIDSPLFRNYVPKGEPLARVDDGIIFSQNGRVLAQANPMDTVYAMKEGGPLLATLATGFESNGKLLSDLHEMHTDHMSTQIELDEERNTLLLDLGKLLFSTLTPNERGRATPGYAGTSDFTGMSVADMRATATGPMV